MKGVGGGSVIKFNHIYGGNVGRFRRYLYALSVVTQQRRLHAVVVFTLATSTLQDRAALVTG